MIVGGHSLEENRDCAVARNVRAATHTPTAGTDLHTTACFRFRQDEKMAAFGGGFRQRRHDGRGAADGRPVAAVPEVEDGEVEALTAADRDAERRALGGAAGQTSSMLTITNQITAAERTIDRPRTRCGQLVSVSESVSARSRRRFHL